MGATARRMWRLVTLPGRIARLFLLVLAGAFGPVRPQFVRHDDPICQVAEARPESESEREP